MSDTFIKPLSSDPLDAIRIASTHAPYLARLLQRQGEALTEHGARGLFDKAMADIAASKDLETPEDTMRALRVTKAQAHLSIAALDLSGQDNLSETTQRISSLADGVVEAALQVAACKMGLTCDGLFMIALGKMGAFELNYSSDIDMAAFFDGDVFDGGKRDAVDAASRIVREAMRLLDERTGDGYVFRTDLRLRPDPSSNPLAISTRRAELYYESVGQNWERMVWIKGRASAGDKTAAAAFLDTMRPFVWRRHLDYWAIADVQAIKNMINTKAGGNALEEAAPDVKLGPGGIREIEFFVQTQQLILGGRNPDLRVRGTLAGLVELVTMGAVEQATADDLATAYHILRAVEHRIQMLEDEQTHTLPADEARRTAVAHLCGNRSLSTFDAAILETRRMVHRHYLDLFADEARKHKAAVEGNLVFTGVDDDPGTVATLTRMGFTDPSRVISTIRQWHRARTPATRSPRGRELLTALLPDLLSTMGNTGEADQAFTRFSKFFEGLRSGVQTLSMLTAEPTLMQDLVATLALSPRIGDILARRHSLLEALLSVSDQKQPPVLTPDTDFETIMVDTRIWQGERAFMLGHSLLHGAIAARDAATAWSDLADTCIDLMARAAEAETVRRYGPPPGVWTVAALGKLGGREMTAGSDIDILVLYEPNEDLDAQVWFTRFTQRLITALSAESGEGRLYEVDMRLRPSGRAGPVATSMTAFERYHRDEAWTWEHMSLTRLRAVAGDMALGARAVTLASALIHGGDPKMRTKDILDMRARLYREKPAQGPWDLKMRTGGLVDLEFIIQHAILTSPHALPHHAGLAKMIPALGEAGRLTQPETQTLVEAFAFLQSLQQVRRLALGEVPTQFSSIGLQDRYCRAVGSDDFTQLEQRLEGICESVAALFCTKIGEPATES
jgi:glutamate-ammonia-ligase adenylyltransferase